MATKRFIAKNGLDNNSLTITNVADPTNAQDASTKAYTDLKASTSQTMYIGTTSVAINRSSANLALTGISSVTLPGSTSGTVQLVPTAAVGTGTVLTIPATTGTIVTTGDSATVTNTMLAGSIAITKLASSTISGISLGSSLNALTISSPLVGTSYNGSAAVTLSIPVATTSASGYLTSTDWNTFNNKQPAGSYLTASTGVTTFGGGTTGLTPAAATSGAITLAGTLAIANGGTNSTATPTLGGVGYGTGSAHAYTTVGTAGQVLQSNAGAAPTWTTLTLESLPDAWVKKSCACATTAALTINTAQVTIDGVTLTATSRVLVKDQAAPAQNGIYTGLTTTTWVRATDADTINELAGASVNVDAGTVNGGKVFDTDLKTTDTLGTTAVSFYNFLDSSALSSTTPAALGTATVGTSTTVARSDHVHTLPSLATLGAQAAGTYVTSVTGTAPVVSSGGITPAISISAATTAAAGSMSSADKTKLDAVTGTNTGDETLATIKTKLGITTLSGSNTGDQTITLTGDITGSGSGSFVTTLATITDSGTGTFKKITTNSKGLVTGSVAVAQADITGLLGAGSISNTMLANSAVANLSGTNTGDQVIPVASSTTPAALGTAAVGTGTTFARADHVHQAPTTITGNAAGLSSTLAVASGGTGLTTVGTSGNVLTSNGTDWVSSPAPISLPTQTGNTGKYLKTDGTTASWTDTLTAVKLSDYQETVVSVTASTATTTLNMSLGSVFVVTISANTAFTFSNFPANTSLSSFTIITINDATAGRAVTWPAAVTWAGGLLPARTTTANKSDVWAFFTIDAGTKIVGSLSIASY